MEFHPILGKSIVRDGGDGVGRVYTRTVVLWAVGISIDPQRLWDNMRVWDVESPPKKAPCSQDRTRPVLEETPPPGLPIVRMMTNATERRGTLRKRLRAAQTFRSVLSLDVEHRGFMPNLKVSARNTVQVTGAQDMEVLGDILHFLVTAYRGRGFEVVDNGGMRPGFVGDVVLANVHFRLNFRLDRLRLRDCVNGDMCGGPFIASYEPLVRDVSVSIKHADNSPLPNGGAVYPRWDLAENKWCTVTLAEAMHLVPHINLKAVVPRITSLRVFQSGSVIVVSRWPSEMRAVYAKFHEAVLRLRKKVVDKEYARQTTLPRLWAERLTTAQG
jgi:hypothetical protein